MNAPLSMGLGAQIMTAADLAEYGPAIGFDERGRELDEHADAIQRMGEHFYRNIKIGNIRVKADEHNGRSDAGMAADAAEVFWTNALEQMLSTIQRKPQSTEYMTGADPLLPIRETLRPGQTDLVYDVETPTGQAAFVEPNGMQRLPQVGEFSERKRHTAHWSGIGYGWGLIESWQAAEKGGPSLDQTRAATARDTLQRFNERVLLYGDVSHGLSGLLKQSQSYMTALGGNFTSLVDDADGAQVKLQIMEHYFDRIAKSYMGQMTGVVAPKTDKYAFQRMRWTDDDPAWPDFLEMHPWLREIVWVDGIETAASTSGPLWIAWSDSPDELWSELSPTPRVYGPFTDNNLRTSFALITHIGGIILRRRERQVRFEFTA